MNEQIELPSQWTHSVKLSETAKGLRIDVHVYADNQVTAIAEALDTYKNMVDVLKENKIVLAPMEIEQRNE